jgi:hypothetical protein
VKHTFSLIYELDTTVAAAVAAYLDVEHYAFLHEKYLPTYEVIAHEGRRIRVLQTWQLAGLKFGNYCTSEYIPPARFLNYELASSPWWLPSIHHLISTKTDLRYYPNATGEKTVSHLDVEVDMPFFLWPFRRYIERKLTTLKIEKDREDIEMIERRARLFGRGNIASYLAEHQFMLHKDAFIEHYGQKEVALSRADPT